MLHRTNLLALVGGGRSPQYGPNKVILYDEKQGRPKVELEFRSNVRRVLLREDRVVVVLASKIHVFTLEETPQQVQTHDTSENGSGICALSIHGESRVMAFPALQSGHVCVTGISGSPFSASIIPAHESPLAALAVDREGNLLATASEKGTLVRVFDIKHGRLLYELRRGADRAEIYSLDFNRDGTKLCVASDKGTVHVFSLDSAVAEFTPQSEEAHSNKQSSLSFMKGLLPRYFSSQWSFAQCRVSEHRCLAAFGQDPATIVVVSFDGVFHKIRFDVTRGGQCIRESSVAFTT